MMKKCASCGKEKPIFKKSGFEIFGGELFCDECVERVKREEFCRNIKPYIDLGLVKEFYYNQYFSICNLANQVYGLILYDMKPFAGLMLTTKEIDYVVSGWSNFLTFIGEFPREKLGDRCFAFNEKMFEGLKKFKKKNDENGPSADIDFAFEEYLSKRSGERIE